MVLLSGDPRRFLLSAMTQTPCCSENGKRTPGVPRRFRPGLLPPCAARSGFFGARTLHQVLSPKPGPSRRPGRLDGRPSGFPIGIAHDDNPAFLADLDEAR